MNKNILKIKNTLQGYLELFTYLFSSKNKHLLNTHLNLIIMIIILGLIGLSRNFLEVWIGGDWARAWFALTPDVFLTMLFYPIFLCFFPTTLLYFFSRLFKLKVNIKAILSLLFFIQIIHLIIPFFDGLANVYNIPFNFEVSSTIYTKLIFSPVALTPLILFFTKPTSFGIDIVWIFLSFIFLKLYLKHFRFPVIESLSVLIITFYITYMSIYPTYYFFLNESIIGSNYMFGLFFMFMSIPSIIYVKTLLKRNQG